MYWDLSPAAQRLIALGALRTRSRLQLPLEPLDLRQNGLGFLRCEDATRELDVEHGHHFAAPRDRRRDLGLHPGVGGEVVGVGADVLDELVLAGLGCTPDDAALLARNLVDEPEGTRVGDVPEGVASPQERADLRAGELCGQALDRLPEQADDSLVSFLHRPTGVLE